jgi:hypothetical protein
MQLLLDRHFRGEVPEPEPHPAHPVLLNNGQNRPGWAARELRTLVLLLQQLSSVGIPNR